jgi:hypothetical protein
MAAQFVHDGNRVDYTPSSAVAAGDVVVQGELVGVATIATGMVNSYVFRGYQPGELLFLGAICPGYATTPCSWKQYATACPA